MKGYNESSENTLKRLGVNPDKGLKDSEVKESSEKYGKNEFTREKQKSFFMRIVDAAKDPMIILLIVAVIITLGVNIIRYTNGGEAEFVECIGIFIAISLSIMITVIMEGKSAKAFETLNKIKDDVTVRVIRNGKISLIHQNEIVVGDIILVETGDKLPADGRLLQSVSLQVDESSLTGESLAVEKDETIIFDTEKIPVAERKNMLYSGCFVTGGSGKMVITDVGDATEFGKIAKELSVSETSSTPIQEKLAHLGKIITILGSAAAVLVFIIQVFQVYSAGMLSFDTISDAFINSIVLIVATVPEGLPTIVAVSLSINIIKMSKQNALVKKLVACETIGSINVICSDKTGTLTENRMTVVNFYSDGNTLLPSEIKDKYLIDNCCINSTGNVEFTNDTSQFIGNPTECALLVACNKSNIDYISIRESASVSASFPFSSETKSMTTVVKNENGYTVFTKGSPEKIISLCSIEPEKKALTEQEIINYQEKACRVIGFAHKNISTWSDEIQSDRSLFETDMIFDGFTAISDPLRHDVFAAIDKCRSAGIDLKILTGDNIVTAKAIAGELGLLDDKHISVEAGYLEDLSDEEFERIIPTVRVIARSTPGIKMKVVKTLKAQGNVVAVTGDGINDAPAIKNADVGIAMGISGTEVSKDASDIVLLDDSFSTIVTAVQWGRGIYENFQRFIQFQLTVNLSSVIVVLVSIIAGFATPFTALQLLWVNLVMDGPPALTLGLEPIREDLMKNKPTKRNAGVVSKNMLWQIVFNGIFIAIIFMLQTTSNILDGTPEQLPSILFTLFIVFQLFNAFNSRELSNKSIFKTLFNNKLMLGVMALTFALQVFITQFGGAVFNTVPLPFNMWIKITTLGFTVILASEIFKLIKRIAKIA